MRLAADGRCLRWVAFDRDGNEAEFAEELHCSWWQRLQRWLPSPLAERWF